MHLNRKYMANVLMKKKIGNAIQNLGNKMQDGIKHNDEFHRLEQIFIKPYFPLPPKDELQVVLECGEEWLRNVHSFLNDGPY